jgi:hypothetical protein
MFLADGRVVDENDSNRKRGKTGQSAHAGGFTGLDIA